MRIFIKIINIILLLILIFFMVIYGIAYVMKDRARNQYSRNVCKEVYESPKNIINLISLKFIGKEMIIDMNINKIIKYQKKVDNQIKKEYSKLEYTWRKPYIKVNPYGITPLSVLIKFKTDELVKVKIEIVDREGTNIEYNFDKYTTEHEYSLIGIYPIGITQMLITVEDKNKKIKTQKISIKNDYKFNESLDLIVKSNKIKNTELYLLRMQVQKIIIDNFGNIRGIFQINHNLEETAGIILKNGNYLEGESKNLFEINNIGKILKKWELGNYSYHHHALEMENGNFLLAVNKAGVTKIDQKGKVIETVEDHIIEIDRETGKIIKEWDIGKILDVNRLYQGRGKGRDWFHMNSFIYDKKDNSLIISGNHQGVIKVDYETGKLKWIMAYHKDWGKAGRDGKGEDLNKYLLYATDKDGNRYTDSIQKGDKIIEEFKFPVGQHDLSLIGKDKILMFDNKRLDAPVYKDNQNDIYSRVVIYEVDEKNMNVKEIWNFGKEMGKDMYSSVVSSAEQVENFILIVAGENLSKNGISRSRIIIIDKITKEKQLDIYVTYGGKIERFYQVNRLK